MGLSLDRSFSCAYGAAEQVSPLVRRVTARNPGPFTFHGTGTYIVGRGTVAVIDPGPALDDHVAALAAALEGETASHILVTHTHLDHSPAAAALKALSGAPTYGYGPHGADRGVAVEEGGDFDFSPDHALRDGDAVAGPGWTLRAVHTPGHTSNHLCFALEEESALFSGDHVMGWSTTVVSPPDGDMAAYMASLDRLRARSDSIYYPTHGAPIRRPAPFVKALAAHRRAREAQILRCLADGAGAVPAMVRTMYAGLDPRLRGAAGRSVLAHLLHLEQRGRAVRDGPPDGGGTWRPAG